MCLSVFYVTRVTPPRGIHMRCLLSAKSRRRPLVWAGSLRIPVGITRSGNLVCEIKVWTECMGAVLLWFWMNNVCSCRTTRNNSLTSSICHPRQAVNAFSQDFSIIERVGVNSTLFLWRNGENLFSDLKSAPQKTLVAILTSWWINYLKNMVCTAIWLVYGGQRRKRGIWQRRGGRGGNRRR